MNISGIRPSSGFYSYNSQKINELRSQQILANRKEQESEEAGIDEEYQWKPQTFTAYDYAQKYCSELNFSLKGSEVELQQLDVEKTKSSLKKDQILQQYQYFVKDNREHKITERANENFVL